MINIKIPLSCTLIAIEERYYHKASHYDSIILKGNVTTLPFKWPIKAKWLTSHFALITFLRSNMSYRIWKYHMKNEVFKQNSKIIVIIFNASI